MTGDATRPIDIPRDVSRYDTRFLYAIFHEMYAIIVATIYHIDSMKQCIHVRTRR